MAEPAYKPQASPLRMTFAEAAELDPEAYPGELVEGEWVPVTRSTYRHGEIATNVAFVLKLYAKEHPEWMVSSNDPGTKLKRRPDSLRGPDVAVVRRDRAPQGRGEKGWLEGAPELAVEILGDSQSMTQLLRKGLEYLRAGSEMVLLLDPGAEQVVVARPPDHFRVLGAGETLAGEEVLPGFSCAVEELFE